MPLSLNTWGPDLQGFNILELPGGINIDIPNDIRIPLPGSGGSNEQAAALVNGAERLMQENLARYRSGEIEQNEALYRFDSIWSQVTSGCTRLRNRACISDRQAGGQFDWFAAYRDPISGRVTPAPETGSRPVLVPPVKTPNGGMSAGAMIALGLGALFLLRR